jgi:hypothetical protein
MTYKFSFRRIYSSSLRLLFGWLSSVEFDKSVFELDARVTAVAEWLVDRDTAPAEGHLLLLTS